MGQIIEFPAIKELNEEINELKKNLEDFFVERDHLLFVICENIETEYMLNFGSLEYSLYKAYCDFLRLRRKKDMIQAKKNRKETIEIDAIEDVLDDEFIEYKKKLDDKISQINKALERSKMESLSKDDEEEIKKLYRDIVKRLHPDLNPEITDAEKELFTNATEAYEKGDIDGLRIIFEIVTIGGKEDKLSSSIEELQKEKKRLQSLVAKIKLEIHSIKANPPYSLRIYVEDDEKKAEKLDELKKELKSFQEAIRTQEEYINELLRREI